MKELQTFLGMATYLGRFTPKLATLNAPLRGLCKKGSEFVWGPEHKKAFYEMKASISSEATLKYYDGKKPLVLQVDASLRGLGAALLQEEPIAYASKAFSETVARYSNIEHEMLAIVFGIERFHHYVYGRHVIVETDYKPLVSITQ